MTIEARKEGEKYTLTKIIIKGKKEFFYDRIEARAKLPIDHGLWPAFWMLGANIDEVKWPKTGEIDILEYIGSDPHMVYTTLHTQDSHGNFGALMLMTLFFLKNIILTMLVFMNK